MCSLTLGAQSYTQAELLNILNTPVGMGKSSDASLILAYQLIAAKLNAANGSDPAPVSSAIASADDLLDDYSGKLPYKVKTSSAAGQNMVNVASQLESYNKGLLTPVCNPVTSPAAALFPTARAKRRQKIFRGRLF